MNIIKTIRKFTIISLILCYCSLTIAATNTPDSTVMLLKELTEAHAAPGFEDHVRNILVRLWKPLLSKIEVDGLGNLIAYLPGSTNAPKVLVMAHMDEVGFYVREISEDGFIYIDQAGGWIDQTILAHRWVIMTNNGPVIGYSGIESSHTIPGVPTLPVVPSHKIFIDIGARNKKEVMEKFKIRPGLPVTPSAKFKILNNSDRYIAKALDDRAGLAVMTEVLKKISSAEHPNQIIFVATVQEELGSRGAQVIYNSIKPDVVINLDMGVVKDFPLHVADKDRQGNPRLGAGPCLFVYDTNMVPNPHLVDWVINLLRKNNLIYQFENEPSYSQDARYIQRSHTGIPAINIGIPIRYGHQSSGIIQRSDYDATVVLIEKILMNLNQHEIDSLKKKV